MEKKVTKKSQVKEEPKTTTEKTQPTYEELYNISRQLSIQSQRLTARVKELEDFWMFRRLDYLFKVLENGINFSEEFLASCVEEIQNLMSPREEEKPEE